MTYLQAFEAVLIGLGAGCIGGIAGIGGSMVMLPGLSLVFGTSPASTHHLYMAAAMAVNMAVAIPAARKHRQAGAVRSDIVRRVLPVMALAIVAGVLLSNLIDGSYLRLGLAAFIFLYTLGTFIALALRKPDHSGTRERTSTPNLLAIAIIAGLLGGLLGIGGGVVMVPALQLLCRLPLRQAIGTSAGIMWLTALIGATLKLATLHTHDQSIANALLLALLMAPGAIIGARIGASLAHSLPLPIVRAIIATILTIAAARMAGLW
ncbi:MAG: sulfite exporter TauE/SafE family protein [Phycisphaeraceae bacterium]|nr:sulfite exporter TauE/SafE family protein [Phycisphaeraceae bacterium]MCW5769709.1 sulfite exporter TauE/SafE family protein [Phycisphaeraceae bacterium]